MKLGFHGATTMTSDLVTDLSVSAQAGFHYLEVWAEKVDRYLVDHSLADLQGLFEHYKITPLALDAIVFIAFRGEEYAQIQARTLELSKIAQAIGCPAIAVVASPLPNRDITWDEIVAEYVRVLRDMSDIARPYGVKLAFEFLGFGWTSVRTPRGAYEIVLKVDRDNIGMVIDAAHFYGGGGLLSELDDLDAAKIFAFHLDDLEDAPKEAFSDSIRILPGEGVVPLNDICLKLKHLGYDGHCSIELFRPEYWQHDPLEVARKAHGAAINILSSHFSLQ
ncbi:MAG TPA: sugar phosphate isomerase/epimerase [Bellilinea sp.]